MPTGTFTAWTLRLLIVASTTILVGLIWDISWHMTIGRDTFWTPAHLFIYIGGAVSGCACGALAIKTTYFSPSDERGAATTLWGGRAPLGAWIAIWGALAMIASGPFDDWWHNAYGLDVKIISPPHILLFSGMISIVFGALVLALHRQNRHADTNAAAPSKPRESGSLAVCYAAGLALAFLSILFYSEGYPNHQHATEYYFLFSCVYPVVLIATVRASAGTWPATKAALSYMAIELAMVWILPRFAATPKLGPVLNPVDHMVPPYFPHLLVIPALGIDLLHRAAGRRGWKPIIVVTGSAAVFLSLFIITQWYFSIFLISHAANNAIFVGGRTAPYYARHPELRELFWEPQKIWRLRSLGKILGAALLSSTAGWAAGAWLRKVRR